MVYTITRVFSIVVAGAKPAASNAHRWALVPRPQKEIMENYDFVKIGKVVSTRHGPGVVRDIATLSDGNKKILVEVFDHSPREVWLDFHVDDVFEKSIHLLIWEISNLAESASGKALYYSRLLQKISSEADPNNVPRENFEP